MALRPLSQQGRGAESLAAHLSVFCYVCVACTYDEATSRLSADQLRSQAHICEQPRSHHIHHIFLECKQPFAQLVSSAEGMHQLLIYISNCTVTKLRNAIISCYQHVHSCLYLHADCVQPDGQAMHQANA